MNPDLRDRIQHRERLPSLPSAASFLATPPKERFRIDLEDPEGIFRKLAGFYYRLIRIVLQRRGFLGVGSSILEAETAYLDPSMRPLSARNAVFGGQGFEIPDVPMDPSKEGWNPEKASKMAILAAFELGFDPSDEILEWLEPSWIEVQWPSSGQLVGFEGALVRRMSQSLVRKGKEYAIKAAEGMVGDLTALERRDFGALSYSQVREGASASVEDDRQLMVARLERTVRRAARALDIRLELAAQRELAKVQGLHTADAERGNRELVLLLNQGSPYRERQPDQRKLELSDPEGPGPGG